MKKYLLAGVSAFFAVVSVWIAVAENENGVVAWVVCVALVALTIFLFKRASASEEKDERPIRSFNLGVPENSEKAQMSVKTSVTAHASPSTPKYTHITFNVAGVTFDNEDGTSRQSLIRKIKFGDPPFENSDSLDVNLHPSTFDGEPSIECRVNDYMIGYVPKSKIQEVLKAMDMPGATISAVDVVGGGTVNDAQLSYGVQIVVRYDNPVEQSSTKTSDYAPPINNSWKQDTSASAPHSSAVYVADGGKAYHRYSTCQYINHKSTTKIDKASAKKQGYRPCKSCFPYGD